MVCGMDPLVKFSSQMERGVLEELRALAKAQGRTFSSVLSEAGREHLERVRVRPEFRAAVEDVLSENDELLRRLAR